MKGSALVPIYKTDVRPLFHLTSLVILNNKEEKLKDYQYFFSRVEYVALVWCIKQVLIREEGDSSLFLSVCLCLCLCLSKVLNIF